MAKATRPRPQAVVPVAEGSQVAGDVLEVLVRASPLAVVVVQGDGIVRRWNAAAERLFGWRAPEVVGRSNSIIPPPAQEDRRGGRGRAWAGQVVTGRELRLTRKNGAPIDARVSYVPLHDPSGHPAGFVAFIEDRTVAKRPPEVLRLTAARGAAVPALERRFRTLVEQLHDMFFLVSRHGVIEYAAPSVTRTIGYARHELVGRNAFDLVHPEDVDHARAYAARALQTGTSRPSSEWRVRHKDGTWRWVEAIVGDLLDDPGVRALTMNLHDITERKLADEARQQLAAIVESSDDAIFGAALDGTILTWNAGAQRMYGYAASEIIGRSLTVLMPPGELPMVQQFRDRLHRGESVSQFDVVRVRKDGSRIHVAITLSPVKDRDGRVTGLATISRDITERKRAEDEIRLRAAHLETLNAIVAAASSTPDLTQLLGVAIEQMLRALGCKMGSIWVADTHITHGLPPDAGITIERALAGAGIGSGASVEDWQTATGAAGKVAPLMAKLGLRASLTVPIQTNDRHLGGLAVASSQSRRWRPEEIALAQSVGRQLGSAVERLRMFADVQQHARLMARLVRFTETLTAALTTSEAVVAIGRGALQLSGADRVAVFVRQPDGAIVCPWALGLSSDHVTEVLRRQAELTIGRLMAENAPENLTLPDGRAVVTRKPFLYTDVRTLPETCLVRRVAEREGYRAVGNWPLTFQGRVIAVASCYYDEPRDWTGAEDEVFQSFCWQAAVSLQNAGLREGQAQRTTELEVLADISKRLRAARTPEEMYPTLVEHAISLFNATNGSLALLDPDRRRFTRAYTVGFPAEPAGSEFPVTDSLSGRVAQTGVPYVTGELHAGALRWVEPSTHRRIGPMAIVPVRSEQEIIGTLALGRPKRPDAPPFADAEVRLLQAIAEMGGTAIRRAQLHQNLEQSYIQMVLALARTVDARDTYTSGHSERIAVWAEAVARTLGCGAAEIQDIRWAALLHDIGKVGVPDMILRKPGSLSEPEWEVMRQHPVIGEGILASTDRMRGVATIVRHHQERWDGTGYPDGLRGEEIPLGARVLAVVDAYSAITDNRPYKVARTHQEAVAELRRCAGTQFEPRIVDIFCEIVERHPGAFAGSG